MLHKSGTYSGYRCLPNVSLSLRSVVDGKSLCLWVIDGCEANCCSGLGTCFHYYEELRKQSDELHLVEHLK